MQTAIHFEGDLAYICVSDQGEIKEEEPVTYGRSRVEFVISTAQAQKEGTIGVVFDEAAPQIIGGPTERMLGDLVISVERAVEQAAEYGHAVERELAFLTVHGLLHLLGYDHEQGPAAEAEMQAEEKRILSILGIGR